MHNETHKVRVVREPDKSVPEIHDFILHQIHSILLGVSFSIQAVLTRNVTQNCVRLSQFHVTCEKKFKGNLIVFVLLNLMLVSGVKHYDLIAILRLVLTSLA